MTENMRGSAVWDAWRGGMAGLTDKYSGLVAIATKGDHLVAWCGDLPFALWPRNDNKPDR